MAYTICLFPFWIFIYFNHVQSTLKVEKIKKENDVQTYKEILAFTEEKNWMKSQRW